MTSATQPKLSRASVVRGVQMLVGGVAGGAVAFAVLKAEDAGAIDLSTLGWSEFGGLALAMVLIVTGLFVTLTSFSPRVAAQVMDPDNAPAPRVGQTVFYRQQGVVTLLAGVMLGIPVAAPLLIGPLDPLLALAVMIAIVALFLVQTALNLSVWTRADEMMRQMIAEAGAACFWILQGCLFLWAAAEKLGLAPPISAWDAVVVLMGFYLLVSSVLAVRRGYA